MKCIFIGVLFLGGIRLDNGRPFSQEAHKMSSKKFRPKAPQTTMTLREESLAENEVLGLQGMQGQMDLIFKVLHEHGINSQLWLEEYLTACEQNGGRPPRDFEKFLPWNLSPAAKERLSKETTFQYGNAHFVRANDGSVFHVRPGGTRAKVDIGGMTAEEFEKLTGIR
jgi:hypothetical protein